MYAPCKPQFYYKNGGWDGQCMPMISLYLRFTKLSHRLGGSPERSILKTICFRLRKITFSTAKIHIMTIENLKIAFDDLHFDNLLIYVQMKNQLRLPPIGCDYINNKFLKPLEVIYVVGYVLLLNLLVWTVNVFLSYF